MRESEECLAAGITKADDTSETGLKQGKHTDCTKFHLHLHFTIEFGNGLISYGPIQMSQVGINYVTDFSNGIPILYW